ncbi:uncharacterized protein [Nicotiana tomentosiformis]|uniref:uncharacterized protein n=1 Tax=Nicotiana tomentosiformis TaxID=4098 RepID=UPI00388CE3C6
MASDAVIIGIISVCGREASVLFNQGSTYLYVSSLFAHFLDIPRESLGTHVYLSTPVGDSVVVDRIYRSCVVIFYGYETRADLLLLDMTDFEVILGMDCLSPYHAILKCHAKTVTLAIPKLPKLEWKEYVRDTTPESPAIVSVQVVWEFSDVFASDLPGIPPDHDIDFCINLALGTQSIFIPPYHMDPKEFKELKEQHEELLAKGFVRPSVLPWGAPVLFVKKKEGTIADVH